MNKFTFDKKEPKVLKMEINGKIYKLYPYTLTVKKAAERFTKCQEPMVKALNKKMSQKELDKLVIQSCNLVRDTVNRMLGKGSYERIFAGRTVDFKEHQDLMTFIFNEITAFCKENPVEQNEPLA